MLTVPEPEVIDEPYPMGASVRIIGGVHRRSGYCGVIVGETWCYVDVHVPQEWRQFRVHKTSVQVDVPRRQQSGCVSTNPKSLAGVTMVVSVSKTQVLMGKRSITIHVSIIEPRDACDTRDKEA